MFSDFSHASLNGNAKNSEEGIIVRARITPMESERLYNKHAGEKSTYTKKLLEVSPRCNIPQYSQGKIDFNPHCGDNLKDTILRKSKLWDAWWRPGQLTH
jgi:hypothetical protein